MKGILFNIKVIISIFSLSLSSIFCINAQEKVNKEGETAQHIQKALDEKDYIINIDYMYPQQGRSRALTSSYFVKIKNDSIFSYLPYVGRAYSVPYGGGDGLNFNLPIQSYSSKKGKKGTTIISVKAKNSEDNYTYTLTVYDNGSSQLHVQSNNKQSISYRGKMDLKKE